jgi:AcrR family transcriptional regulator
MRLNQAFVSEATGTRDRILDAAERLFAEQGFYVTTLRAITQAAEVNLAAVNYHFGSKQALVIAVFQRRLDELSSQRLARLDQAHNRHEPPVLEDVLDAFVYPAMALMGEQKPGAHRFMQLLMRAYADHDETLHGAISQEYGHVMRRFAQAVEQAMRGEWGTDTAPKPEQIRQHLDFLVGALTYTMADANLKNPRATASSLVTFAAAGIRSLPATSKKTQSIQETTS